MNQRLSSMALWYVAPKLGQLKPVALGELAPDHCRVATRYSAMSRGTESLVFNGLVPASEYERMATPLMQGSFPFPVTYGYCNVGTVIEGPEPWLDQAVFCLAPHQSIYDAPISLMARVPDGLPLPRAAMAANMETALNAVWTGKPGPADQIAIVGGGVVGLLVAYLCTQLPGANVTLIDPLASREAVCTQLGVRYAPESGDLKNCDVVFHASGHGSGLQTSISLAGKEATVVELSWYGSRAVTLELGGAFHSQQLRLQSCQVGHIENSHRSRWSYQRRLCAALDLLFDDRLDALLEPAIAFTQLGSALDDILGQGQSRLCQIIDYS
jgi:hypothetical protein